MNQKIICRSGKCVEDETIETEFDSLFDKANVVEKIQHDLIKNMLK